MQNRVLNTVLWVTSVTCGAVFLCDFYYNFDPIILWSGGLGALTTAFLYYLSRFKKESSIGKSLYFPFAFIILGINWFYKDGFFGPVPTMWIVVSILSIIILKNKSKLILWSSTLGLIALWVLSLNVPEIIEGYPSQNAKFWCLTLSYLSAGFTSFFSLLVISKSYLQEKSKNEAALKRIKIQGKKAVNLNKKLQGLVEQKNKLLSIISHDSRAPIANISAMLNMIQDKDLSEEEFKSFLPNLEDSVKATASFMDNLLIWSRAQSDGIKPEPSNFHARFLIQDIISLYESIAESKNIKLQFDCVEDFKVMCDYNMIHAVLRNLMNNALKFSKPSSKIKVSMVKAIDYVNISVEDNGAGISNEKMNEILGSTKYGETGINELKTGLGLQISKEFVVANNGELWMKSEVGKGSVISFSLPAAN